jgi:TonB family protein
MSSFAGLHFDQADAAGAVYPDRRGRLGGAVGTAALAHVALALAVWGVASVPPAVQPSAQAVLSSIAPFVFTAGAGESGGRSAGGNHSTQPPALLRTRGVAAMAVTVAPPPAPITPDTIAPESNPAPWTMPVRAMDAGELPQVGALDGVPGPPIDARGPGDGGVGTRPGHDRGLGSVPGSSIGDGPSPIGNGVTPPDLIYRTQPRYTAEAMRAKLQGVALLSGVVGIDGVLHDIRILRSLDGTFGLDQEAITCVQQWRFRPGTRQGKPIPVYVTMEVGFNLR